MDRGTIIESADTEESFLQVGKAAVKFCDEDAAVWEEIYRLAKGDDEGVFRSFTLYSDLHVTQVADWVNGHFEKIRSHVIPRILELENPRDRWIAAELEMWESSLALLLQDEGLKVDYGPRLVTEEMQRSWERDEEGGAAGE